MTFTSRVSRRAARGLTLALLAGAPIALAQPQSGPQKSPQNPETQQSQQLPSLSPLVESVRPAVVNVQVQAKGGGPGGGGQDFFNPFGGGNPFQQRDRIRQGEGSGFIIDPAGYILTNNHVVEGAVAIRVKLMDAREFDATVVGRDPLTDVALLKLRGDVKNLSHVKLGSSDALRVGDWVLAIGSPFGLSSSVSLGILSAKARNIQAGPYDDFLQTDAAINPGNSGGPLFNMKGEVIGINTAIVGGGTGIGFAVPSDMVRVLLPQLQKEGVVTRGWLGIGIQDLTPDIASGLNVPVKKGAVVLSVNDDAPAAKSGLKADDVVSAIDGKPVESAGDLTRAVALKQPGASTTLTVHRGKQKLDVKVQLGKRPDLEGLAVKGRGEGEEKSEEQRLGLTLREIQPREAQQMRLPAGALITNVNPGSPAERAELAPGMVVVEANKKPVKSAQELSKILRGAKSGSTVLLRVVTGQGGSRLLRALRIP